jgi:hypothetical protein
MMIHVVILVGMAAIRMQLLDEQTQIVVETFFTDERDQQEFSQELEINTEISETQNVVAATSFAATNVSSSGAPSVAQQKIETSESLKEPTLLVNPGEISLPGDGEISEGFGEGVVDGGMDVVTGYAPALGRITQELIRIMRKSRVHVVWLFDESDSMKDDQEQIRQKFHKVYEELGIQLKRDEKFKRDAEILWTTILSYGESVHPLTKKPTADINKIRAAINNIKIDESGVENTCGALKQTLDKFGPAALPAKRKLVLILVTDESGDDGQYVEDVVERAKKFKAPIYILGRESVFGYPYAHIVWMDPKYGLPHWLRINRGPETGWPECLQWDGFHRRWDADRSGFGPYEQVRIARESGGIYFMLPGEEENLSGRREADKRYFDFLDMKEYQPELESRRIYEQQRTGSTFRTQIWNVIVTLNPHLDNKLNINHWHYSMKPVEFRKQGAMEFQKAWRAMAMTNQALAILAEIKPLRDKESSQRWRANYDLATAQLLSYRVRLFQFLLAMDRHAANPPQPKDPKSNEWHIHHTRTVTEPDDQQFDRLKKAYKLKVDREEFLQELKTQQTRARKLYQFVIIEHPGTPWARRASHELALGFGVNFVDRFWDPRYRNIGKEIKFPKP